MDESEFEQEELGGVEVEPPLDDEPSSLWKVGLVFGALAAGVVALLAGVGGDAFVYSKTVQEVMAEPDEFIGRDIRVEGGLVPGSIVHREDPCEWRFVIEQDGEQLTVRFPHCVVPDTFRDGFGITVIAQGELDEEHVFVASEIVPRCPSKYEMQQQLEAGEDIPHAMPGEMPTPAELGLDAFPDASP